MAAEKKAERAEKVKMSIDGQERFRNWAERLWPGRRWLAIVLLPAIPVMAAALLTGDREISWGQLVATFYVLFLLAAICSRDFAARYIISSGAGRCLWRICWDRETAKGNGDDVNGGQFWRYGGMAMKTEKANLLEFCGSAVLFLAGAYFLPMWTAWGICDNTAGDGVCRQGLLTGIFTAAYVAAFWGQAWLNARLAGAEERRSYQRLALFLWLYLALCGTGLAVKILV